MIINDSWREGCTGDQHFTLLLCAGYDCILGAIAGMNNYGGRDHNVKQARDRQLAASPVSHLCRTRASKIGPFSYRQLANSSVNSDPPCRQLSPSSSYIYTVIRTGVSLRWSKRSVYDEYCLFAVCVYVLMFTVTTVSYTSAQSNYSGTIKLYQQYSIEPISSELGPKTGTGIFQLAGSAHSDYMNKGAAVN